MKPGTTNSIGTRTNSLMLVQLAYGGLAPSSGIHTGLPFYKVVRATPLGMSIERADHETTHWTITRSQDVEYAAGPYSRHPKFDTMEEALEGFRRICR